ncbi:uncharacterized protein LOC120278458 [Dioscorea cayenensis subsp. rotundata]|uniref:Uncharacterized protein LOC120278458 n=1 Tax=Dioscorea cayennensis subsp. rotundata TaxID=55577 RepID=A0AB40CMR2_DIOCR|nr:uncharacterized protein LOC120278458 [Dioscorea cayenensis subsp. rotundata]
MLLDKATFPPHQQPAGVLFIRPSSEDQEIVSMEVGDQFSDSEHFKDALRNFAIKRNFIFTFIKNDKQRVTVKCAAEGCEWRAHASMEGNHQTFRIKTMYPTHTCGGCIGKSLHPKASKKWVSARVIHKLNDRPLYRAIDIQHDMLRDQGVYLSYKQAWLGKEVTKEVLHGSKVASYDLLMWYAKKVLVTNPGSVAIVENDSPGFKRAFFDFEACVIGFKTGCRPLLYLDETHLLGKYMGTLLGATGKDGNDGFFHVAFVIVDNETDANWTWFLSKLGDTIYDNDEYVKLITFISDRSKGLINAVAKVFPSSPHVYCLRHLEANFMKANVRLEFDEAVADLLNTSADAHQWLMQKSDLAHWANYMFKGERWGDMYSNVAESFNAWIKEARHLPVTNMVDSIRWERRLCPVIHRKIEELVEESCNLLVGRSDGDHFEVVDQKNYCINLNAWTCSCRRWQVYGIPCKHACAAILQTDTNIHRYVDDYFIVDSYRQAYTEAIFPVPDNDKPDDINRELLVRPPITKKPVGRPRQKRLESQASIVHELRCSRCHDVWS